MNPQDPETLVRAVALEPIPMEPTEVLEERRKRMVEALGRAIRQSSIENERRLGLRTRLAAFGAVAAMTLAGLGAYALSGRAAPGNPAEQHASVATVERVTGTLVATHAGRARIVTAGEPSPLGAGDELRTATDGGAVLRTERSKITIAPATELKVLAPSALEERIRLAVGKVDLSVSKLAHTPRSVVVETPNAEVVVRGTVFSVAVSEKGGTPNTHVHVTEGSVWVLSGSEREIISTGETWDSAAPRAVSGITKTDVPTLEEGTRLTIAGEPRRERDKARPRLQNGRAPDATTTLKEENRLFQAAVEARNRGEDRRAIEGFGALIARFPKGALAEEARVERMRALRRIGDKERASAEARRYLSEFPNGFGREEARDAALGGK